MPILEHSISDRWFAMPLGKSSLTRRVEDHGAIDGYQLPSIIRGLAQGLGHAHRQEYVHRDVNPNNIVQIVDDDGPRWVLGDWGLVFREPRKGSPRWTRRNNPIGTDGFTAPEAEADPTDWNPDLDVYSLGRVAHYALTSSWPRARFPMPAAGWLWEDFVERCTSERGKRPSGMTPVVRMVNTIDRRIQHMQDEAEGLACPRCEAPVTGARCESCGRVWD
jgi:serine/threonine-protein kinase